MTRAMLKTAAKQQLQGRWTTAVAATLIIFIISGAIAGINSFGVSLSSLEGYFDTSALARPLTTASLAVSGVAAILYILLVPVLTQGYYIFSLHIARGEQSDLGDLFRGFRVFLKVLGLYIVTEVLVLLWSLLLVVPGIIAGFRYSQAFFILADNPDLGIMECIRRSKAMMQGHKMEYFVLELSFLGWIILSCLCMVGLLWLMPYLAVTYANYYLYVRDAAAPAPDCRQSPFFLQ